MQEYPLHEAVKKNDFLKIKQLVEEDKINIDSLNREGKSALFLAAQKKDPAICKYLLEKGANVDVVTADKYGITPLWTAAQHGFTDTLQMLIDHGANIHILSKSKLSALHAASNSGKLESAKLLISKGMDVNAKDHQNRTPLFWAARATRGDVVEYLLEHGAQPDCEDLEGVTPLGAVLTIVNEKNDAPSEPELKSIQKTMKALMDKSATAKFKGKTWTSLYTAVMFDSVDAVKRCLSNNAVRSQIDAKSEGKFTAFWRAAQRGNVEIMRVLFEQNANINLSNSAGATPLHMSVLNGHLDAVQFLIEEAKASPLCLDESDSGLLHLAVENDNTEVLEYLLTRKELDINAKDNTGSTPLFRAVHLGNFEAVKCLVKNGADLFYIHPRTDAPVYVDDIGMISHDIMVYLCQERDKQIEKNPDLRNRSYAHWPAPLPTGAIITDSEENFAELVQVNAARNNPVPKIICMPNAPETQKPYEFFPAGTGNSTTISFVIDASETTAPTSTASSSAFSTSTSTANVSNTSTGLHQFGNRENFYQQPNSTRNNQPNPSNNQPQNDETDDVVKQFGKLGFGSAQQQ